MWILSPSNEEGLPQYTLLHTGTCWCASNWCPGLPIKAPHGWEETATRTFAMETLAAFRKWIIIQLGDVISHVSVTLSLFPKNLGFFSYGKHPECLCRPNLIDLTEMLLVFAEKAEKCLELNEWFGAIPLSITHSNDGRSACRWTLFPKGNSCPALKSLVMINGTISAWMLLSLSLVVLSCGNGWWVKTWDMAENQNIELAVRLQWAAIILLHSNTVWNAQGSAHKPFLSWKLKNDASLYLTIFGLLLCESLHPPSGKWEHSKEHCRELPSLALSFSCQNLSLPITGEKQSQAEAQCSGWCPLANLCAAA